MRVTVDDKLERVALPVADLARSREFYGTTLGWHADLTARGVECSPIEELAWGRFVHFADPDGNTWTVQQLPDWSSGAQ